MSYTQFTNFMNRCLGNIPLDDMEKLWKIYQEKIEEEEIYNDLQPNENHLLNQLIFAYPYAKDLSLEDYIELINIMIVTYNEVYFYQLTYFDSVWIGKTRESLENLFSSFHISSDDNDTFFKCFQAYVNELIDRRIQDYYGEDHIEEVYKKEIPNVISPTLTSSEQQEYVDECMDLYHKLCDITEHRIPKYVIKNSALLSYNNDFDLSKDQKLSLALGLCQMKNLSTCREVSEYLLDIYSNENQEKIYKNEYFCYGVLQCLDWKDDWNLETVSSDFFKGMAYFRDFEEDKLFVVAQNINDAWHDFSIKTMTSDFQLGLLYQGYQVFLKNDLLDGSQKSNKENILWYAGIQEYVQENIEFEIEIAQNIYHELMLNPTLEQDISKSEDTVKQSILSSYGFLCGDISYEQRRDLVVAMLYVKEQIAPFLQKKLSDTEIDNMIEDTIDSYKKSNFLNSQYKNKEVEKYIYETIQNYDSSYYIEKTEQDLFEQIDILVQSVCANEEERKNERSKVDKIYKQFLCICEETGWDLTKEQIQQALYHSYTYLLIKKGKLLDYSSRFNLTYGFLCSIYASSNLHILSEAVHRIAKGDSVQDVYFIYGMIVQALMDYNYEDEVLSLNETIQSGIDYSINHDEVTNVIWDIAKNLDDYTHDLMHPVKEIDFIKGIIYGTYDKKLKPSKQFVKNYINLN